MEKNSVKFEGDLIHGNFIIPKDPIDVFESVSPADVKDILGKFEFSYMSVDRSVESAQNGLALWKKKTFEDRAKLVKDVLSNAKKLRKEVTSIISRETGKPLWESETEFMIASFDAEYALNNIPKMLRNRKTEEAGEGLVGGYVYKPRGVFAVIGSFSSPYSIPFSMIIPALLSGNTIVFKPSMKVPATGQILAKIFACLPAGVFNMIQGNAEVGSRLAKHPEIDGVLFSGSYDTGYEIRKETLNQHWKNLSLETGGKNSMIIFEDSDFEIALEHAIASGYMTAGQRNSSLSRCIVHNSLLEKFIDKLHKKAKELTVGPPAKNCFMGPLISDEARDQYVKFHGIATREGAECIMRGKGLDLDVKGFYATPSIYYVDDNDVNSIYKSVYQQTEILGPNLAIYGFDEADEAIKIANASNYGLISTVYSANHTNFDKCFESLKSGLIYWNVPTVYYSPSIPYGGIKKSSNNWPRGLFTSIACTYPQSYLKAETPHSDGIPGARRAT